MGGVMGEGRDSGEVGRGWAGRTSSMRVVSRGMFSMLRLCQRSAAALPVMMRKMSRPNRVRQKGVAAGFWADWERVANSAWGRKESGAGWGGRAGRRGGSWGGVGVGEGVGVEGGVVVRAGGGVGVIEGVGVGGGEGGGLEKGEEVKTGSSGKMGVGGAEAGVRGGGVKGGDGGVREGGESGWGGVRG